MPRRFPSIPLSNMRGGINRYVGDAGQVALVDGEDVVVDDGELRRRDAFVSLGIAAPHLLPGGKVTLKTQQQDAAHDDYADRTPTGGDDSTQIYIGCTEPFDGIWWPSAGFSGTFSEDVLLSVRYSNGSTFTSAPWFRDGTRRYHAGSERVGPLVGFGAISWHRSLWSTAWAQQAVDGVTAYWIELQVQDYDGNKQTFQANLYEPGVQAFLLAPVNGLFDVRLRGRRQLVVCSDRQARRGVELGAKLGRIDNRVEGVRPLYLREDEGAGTHDQGSYLDWDGVSTVTRGTSGKLEKERTDYSWVADQHLGGKIADLSPPQTAAGAASVTASAAAADRDDQFEHCVLEVTDASGINGEQREVHTSTAAGVLSLDGDYSSSPTTANEFDLRKPGPVVQVAQDRYRSFEIADSDAGHTLTLASGRNAAADFPSALDGEPIHWRIVRDPRWAVPAGARWSGVLDPATRELWLWNGHVALAYDGDLLRTLEADQASQAAKNYVGDVPGGAPGLENFRETPQALLASAPPVGAWAFTYQGRVVVGGGARPYDVHYSAPAPLTNVWPKVYTEVVRGPKGDAPRGGAVLNDRMIVFSATSIHECDGPDDYGFLRLRVAANGIGFTSHEAVELIALSGRSALIGPTPDGVAVYDGAEPTHVLDAWDRVLEGGVNESALHRAVGVSLPQRGWYVLAVAPRSSTQNTRLLVYDYRASAWWVWTCPLGVSALATSLGPDGREVLLLGLDDGHVAQLLDAELDDGATITGRARTNWVTLGAREQGLQAVVVTAKEMGANELTCALHVDRRSTAYQSGAIPVDGGGPVLGTDDYADDSTTVYRATGQHPVRINARSGTRASAVALEISGASRWRVNQAELITRPMSRRGRYG